MDRSFFDQPNEHCMGHLVKTSANRAIVATEDIYDQRGLKLLARGRPITGSIQERLLAKTLKKPLEVCLQVEDGLSPAEIASIARRVLEECPTIAALVGSHAHAVLASLEALRLSGLPHVLLTAISERDSASLPHAVTTALIAASLALRLRLSPTVAEGAIVAGLLHDLGEIYVDPAVLGDDRELPFEEWKKIAVHPRIGAMLLSEFTHYPAYVAQAVLEHHERLDGSGYPAGLRGGSISELGQILMTAEVLAAILPSRHNPQASALLAMRLVPGQFASQVVSVLASVYGERAEEAPPSLDLQALTRSAHDIAERLAFCKAEAHRLHADASVQAPQRALAEEAQFLCTTLTASLHSTGVMSLLDQSAAEAVADPTIAFELRVVTTELKWRMKALARHIALASTSTDRPDDPLRALMDQLHGTELAAQSGTRPASCS